MQSSIAKLLLVFVLCTVSWTYVEAENKVTVTGFSVDVPGNDVVESWNYDLTNNLIGSTINVKQNCPDIMQADIKVYQGGNMVNQISKTLEKPIKDFENYGICASIDSPEPEDDACTVAQGDQTAKDCDVSGWFSDMSPGDYRAECDFKLNNNVLASVKLDVKVESG